MCGIAGILSINGAPPSRAALERMGDTIAHRGPDGAGVFVENGIGLAHRRLSIIDLDGGKQPMFSPSERFVIVYNGEIYNYQELRRSLVDKGYPFQTHSDTEVILALYEEQGLQGFEKLSGMFALAIWDRDQRELILARDRVGIKPLYVAETDGNVYFSSEIKSIRQVASFNALDEDAVNGYFIRQYVGGPKTVFRGIHKFPPGSIKVISADIRRHKQYWALPRAMESELSLDQATDQVESVLDASVKRHLVSDVPVGVFLSGGVDSSTLLAMASHHADEALHTFSVGFGEGDSNNEVSVARKVAEHFRSEHHELHVTGDDSLDVLEHVVSQLDQPLADYAIVPTYVMCKFASQTVKVVLSGEGADEVFGGYVRYRPFAVWDRIQKTIGLPLPDILPEPPPPLFTDGIRRKILGNRFCAGNQITAERELALDRVAYGQRSALAARMAVDTRGWLVDDLLMKVDNMGMLASLEARVPYLDPEVIRCLATVASDHKVGMWHDKRVLRRLAARRLPEFVAQRKKHGFTVPVGDWLRGALKRRFEDLVFDGAASRDWLDGATLQGLWKRHQHGADLGQKLWSILLFAWWFERHIKIQDSPVDLSPELKHAPATKAEKRARHREKTLGKMLYVLWGFPELSETFIQREMVAMQELFAPVHVLAGQRVKREDLSPPLADLERRALYLGSTLQWTARGLAWAAKHPERFGRTLKWVLGLAHRTTAHRSRMVAMLLAAAAMADEIVQRDIQYLHAHFASYHTEWTMCLSRLCDIPYGATFHATGIWKDRNIIEEKVAGARVILTCTKHNIEHLYRLCPQHRAKIHLLSHGLDFSDVPKIAPWPAGDMARFVAVGRMVPKKGFPVLLEALAILRSDGMRFQHTFLGDGPMRAELEAQSQSLGLEDRVSFRGAVSIVDVWREIACSHALIAPSVIDPHGDMDGIPNVTLEAMASGRPVIGTNLSGIPEVVHHAETGYLVEPGDVEGLAGALQLLAKDLEKAKQMGKTGRALVESRFDIERNAEKQMDLMVEAAALPY